MRRLLVHTILALAAAGPRPAAAGAQDVPERLRALETPEGTLVLSLERCMELALGGNVDLAIGRQAPRRRAQDFFIAGEIFTPSLYVEARNEDVRRRSVNTQVGAEIFQEEQAVVEGRIRKTWVTGARTDLAWAYTRAKNNSEFRTLNPSYTPELALELTQPLLKGFGVDVNRADLDRAIHDKAIADHEFEIQLEGELLGAYRAYWALVRAAEDLALQETSLTLAEEQVAIVRDRLQVGAAAPLELTSAQAAQARQQEAVIGALNVYRKAGDALLYRIHPASALSVFELSIIPSTVPEVDEPPALPELRAAVETALANRPELKLEETREERADVDVAALRNNRLPDLNLFGRYGFNGLAADVGEGVDDITSGTFPEWTAGVSLEFLFGGRSRRARWQQAVIDRETAALRGERAAALVALDVRAAVFDLEAALKQREAAARTLELQREQYEGERDRLAVGASTVFRVDTFRRDLLEAERNDLDARIGVFVAQAVLDAARGQFAKSIMASVETPATAEQPPAGPAEAGEETDDESQIP